MIGLKSKPITKGEDPFFQEEEINLFNEQAAGAAQSSAVCECDFCLQEDS